MYFLKKKKNKKVDSFTAEQKIYILILLTKFGLIHFFLFVLKILM